MQNINDKICAADRLCPHDPAEWRDEHSEVSDAVRRRGSVVFIFGGWGGAPKVRAAEDNAAVRRSFRYMLRLTARL